jgi:hypothetical protein
LAVIYDEISADQFAAAQRQAELLHLEVQSLKLENPPYDFDAAFHSLAERSPQMLLVQSSAFFTRYRSHIAELAIQQRLPTMFIFRSYAEAGGLISYGVDPRAAHADVTETMMVNGLGVAPVNQLVMWHDYVDPSERSVGDPNQDVVYGLSYMDLGKEPVIVQVPEFGDRYWVIEVEDARADEFSQLGKQYGTKPGFYMIAGPNWKGATPDWVAGVLRSSTNGAISFPRIFMTDSPEDRAAIQPLINQIMFYPLSQFDGKMKTKDWSKIPAVKKEVKPAKYSNTQPPWVDPATFFDQLPQIMKEVPPLPGEEKMSEWINSVLDAAAKEPEVMKTLRETAFAADEELIQPMTRWRYNGQPASNGWTAPDNLGAFGIDYIHRAGMMYAGPYDALRTEVKY